MNRKLMSGLLALVMLLGFAAPSYAAWGWYECNIVAIARTVNNFDITVTSADSSFSGTKLMRFHVNASADQQKEMIAIALTAMSLNKTVKLLFDSASEWSLSGVRTGN